jgi:hypothetical protein
MQLWWHIMRLPSVASPSFALLPSGQERIFQILGQRIFLKLSIFHQNNLKVATNMLFNEIFSYRYQESKWWIHLLPVPELFNRLNLFHQTWYSCAEWKAGGPRLSTSYQGAATLRLFWWKIDNFKKIRCPRIWKILSWPDGRSAKDGLATEGSLMICHHNCILSLVIDECRREKWGFKVSAFIQDSSWHRWRWDRKCSFFAGHHQYQTLKKKVEQNRITL